jgi:hypothetical protein
MTEVGLPRIYGASRITVRSRCAAELELDAR